MYMYVIIVMYFKVGRDVIFLEKRAKLDLICLLNLFEDLPTL